MGIVVGSCGLDGDGEGPGGAGGFEGDALAGGDLPARGGDFDELAVGVGEIEEDFLDGGVAAGIDAEGDADLAAVGIADGLGFEVMEDGGEGVGGGDGVEFGVGLIVEPLAEGAGADGEGLIAEGLGADGDEGASSEGGEGLAAAGDVEESVELRHDLRYSIGGGSIRILKSAIY